MRERAVTFGRHMHLAGILTEPEPAKYIASVPTLLILNAGLLHRVGPHRMSVDLSRRAAEAGIRSLRFDVGGRGDSLVSISSETDEEKVLADIVDAMDYVQNHKADSQFVLFGLCAGADNAYLVASRDARVAGAIFLDGHGFRTLRFYVVHYLPRLLRFRSWIGFLKRLAFPLSAPHAGVAIHGERRPFGERQPVERQLQSLVDRGMRMLYVYTNGVAEEYYNYPGQFWDMFPNLKSRNCISVEHYPAADHTFTVREDREQLLERSLQWLLSRFPPHPNSTERLPLPPDCVAPARMPPA